MPSKIAGRVLRSASNLWSYRRAAVVDATSLSGIGLVVYGVSMIYLPAAYILAGLALVGLSVLGVRNARSDGDDS